MYSTISQTLPGLITDGDRIPVVRDAGPGQTVWRDGKPVARNPAQFWTVALVVPVSGDELLQVPEGQRDTEQYWLFQDPAQTQLADGTATELPLAIRDKVQLDGQAYQVQAVERWRVPSLMTYVRARAMKIDVGPDAISWPVYAKESQ